MMKICEGKYYASYSLIEYHGNLFYMLHNGIRLQTFQKKGRKNIIEQTKKIHFILIFKDDTLPKKYLIQKLSGGACHFNH